MEATTENQTAVPAPLWAVVDIMGHRRFGGRVCEETHFGAVFMRLDIPQADGSFVTLYYGAPAIYSWAPTTEATARAVAAHYRGQPVQPYEMLPPGRARPGGTFDESDPDAAYETGRDRFADADDDTC